jgi:hypothetical protein
MLLFENIFIAGTPIDVRSLSLFRLLYREDKLGHYLDLSAQINGFLRVGFRAVSLLLRREHWCTIIVGGARGSRAEWRITKSSFCDGAV